MRVFLGIISSLVSLLCFVPAGLAQIVIEDVDESTVEIEDAESDSSPTEVEVDLSQKVLVVPFGVGTSTAAGLASLMEQFVLDGLRDEGLFLVSSLEDAPPVEDVDAALYYRGCPPGDERGCQLVLGELAAVDRVVAGTLNMRDDGSYSVEVTVLNVAEALIELSYSIDLVPGEEELLPQTVSIALRELVVADREEQEDAQLATEEQERRERLKAASAAEEELLARMVLDVSSRSLEEAEAAVAAQKDRRVTQQDLQTIKSKEGAEREWIELGLSEKQYLSYRNSGLELEAWRWRWAGHRFQLIGSIHMGLAAGATGMRYYGNYLLSPDLAVEPVDSHSWQVLEDGQNGTLGVSVGFGILRNLDVELGFWWTRSKIQVKLVNGRTIDDGSGNLVPDPLNRQPGDFTAQSLNMFGGELMARFYLLNVFPVRPTVGAGLSWISYPTLYNDPDIDDSEELPPPSIPERYTTWPHLVDVGLQIEPGVTVDIGRHLGIFFRIPITIGLSNSRRLVSNELPRPIIEDPEQAPEAPFGTIRVLLGVQGRVFGKKLPLRADQPEEDILEEDE
jgi:hypothetical protein